MAKRHPVRNLQSMKAIRDVHPFPQEESLKIKKNGLFCLTQWYDTETFFVYNKNQQKHNQKIAQGIWDLQFTR